MKTHERSWTLLLLPLLAMAGALPGEARAAEVISVAHAPSSPQNRFTLQCGRTGVIKTSLLLDAGPLPTKLMAAVEVGGQPSAVQRRQYAQGPAYEPTARKIGGKENRWLLGDAFVWKFRCHADCTEVRVGERAFAGNALEFRFVAGEEAEPRPDEPPRFTPRSTAESEVLTLRCQPATALPPG